MRNRVHVIEGYAPHMQHICVTFTLLIKTRLLPFIAALSDFLQSFMCNISTNSYEICVLPQGKISKHNRQPLISIEKKLIIGPPEVLRGSRGPTLLKIHGEVHLKLYLSIFLYRSFYFMYIFYKHRFAQPGRWLLCDCCYPMFHLMLRLHQFAKDNRWLFRSGALMLLAWMVTGSVGTFIASFYKPDWPRKTLFGQKVWFQVSSMHPKHRHMLP